MDAINPIPIKGKLFSIHLLFISTLCACPFIRLFLFCLILLWNQARLVVVHESQKLTDLHHKNVSFFNYEKVFHLSMKTNTLSESNFLSLEPTAPLNRFLSLKIVQQISLVPKRTQSCQVLSAKSNVSFCFKKIELT